MRYVKKTKQNDTHRPKAVQDTQRNTMYMEGQNPNNAHVVINDNGL